MKRNLVAAVLGGLLSIGVPDAFSTDPHSHEIDCGNDGDRCTDCPDTGAGAPPDSGAPPDAGMMQIPGVEYYLFENKSPFETFLYEPKDPFEVYLFDNRQPMEIGLNPVNPYQANLHRQVPDIATFGAAAIPFTRIYNSRTLTFNSGYWDFGMDEGWQHNWNYEVRQLSSKTFGFFDIKVRYPDGNEYNFVAADSTGQQLVPVARSGDRLYRWPGTPVGYTLVTPEGYEYDFLRYLSPKFDLKVVRNGQGLSWVVTHDTNHKIKRITNDFGRWLEIERSAIGTAEIISKVKTDDGREVLYNYSAWVPTSELTLTSVDYPGGEQAIYTWVGSDSLTTGRPLLGSADDPMYGGPGARTKYDYNYSFIFDYGSGPYLVTGVILNERNGVDNKVIVSMPQGAGPFPEIREGNGTELIRKYTSSRLTEVQDGEGRKTEYTYDSGGHGYLASVMRPNLQSTSYTRDFAGRVTSVTDPYLNTATYGYNSDGHLTSYTDKLNRSTLITRDSSNRITRTDFPDGSYEEWTYNTYGQPLTCRLRNSGTSSTSYDAQGNVSVQTDAEGNSWTYTYDTKGLVATITDPRSNTTSFSYDWRGQMVSITRPDASTVALEYDDYGNRVKETNELGKETEFTYNEYNRLVTVTDPLNRETHIEYGREPGCSSCVYTAAISKVTTPSGRETEFTYDLSWKLLTTTIAPGTPEESITTNTYNSYGELISVANGEGETTEFTYDFLGRCLTITDPLNQTTSFTWDAVGNKLSTTLADSSVTSSEYDEMNRVVKTVDALGEETELAYNSSGNLVSLTDARNNTYSYEYDLRGLKTKKTFPDASFEEWSYDEVANLATYKTRAGAILTATYDARNRQTLADWNDITPDVDRTFDAVGRPLTINNEHSELTFTYDDAGQLISERQNILLTSVDKTVAYEYNDDGLRSKMTYPDGKELVYNYTERNQLENMNFNYLTNPLVQYTYDLAGRRIKKELNNFTETNYSYDLGGRLVSVVHQNAAAVFDQEEYGYNMVNNRVWEKRLGGLGDVYTYDAIQQLTGVQYDATNPDTTPSSPVKVASYGYDATGNRTAAIVNSSTTSYVSNSLNQYSSVSSSVTQYNANGNLVQSGTKSFGYDSQNRMIDAVVGASTAISIYDGLNRKVGYIKVPTLTLYIYDGWNVIEEYSPSGSQLAATAHGPGVDEYIFRWAAGYNLCYYHQDGLGNVTKLTDTSGAVVEQISYDAFGTPTITNAFGVPRSTSFFGNRYLFTGREYLYGVGVYDYRNRVYSPELGRFLQADPIGFSAGDANIYRYVRNNPINAIDPMGLTDIKVDGVIWRTPSVSDAGHVHLYEGVDQGPHMHGSNGSKFFPNTGRTLNKNGRWDDGSVKFLKKMDRAMRSKLGRGLGIAGLMALLQLMAGEANGETCASIDDILSNLDDFKKTGDDISARAAAAGISDLFGNSTAALMIYHDLTK